MKFACLIVVAVAMATLVTAVDFGSADSYGLGCSGSIAIAAEAVVWGNMITSGVCSTGAGSMVVGDLDASGAVALGTSATFKGILVTQSTLAMGADERFYGDIYAAGSVTIAASTAITGNVKSCPVIFLGASVTISGETLWGDAALAVPASNGAAVFGDITAAYTDLSAQSGGRNLEESIINNTLAPGIYYHLGAWARPAGPALILNGTSSDKWIIQLGGAVAISCDIVPNGPSSNNYPLASNIQWVGSGAVAIAAGSIFYGNIVALGTVAIAAGAEIHGVIYSGGACSLGAGAELRRF